MGCGGPKPRGGTGNPSGIQGGNPSGNQELTQREGETAGWMPDSSADPVSIRD
ncbi:hypothetical protein GCM10027580_01200 [Corynebacterium faecale]